MFSLEGSVRTCDVNTGDANRIQSDRFFNPNNMVCVPWNGLNSKGQEVCPDSFYTKTAGCDSAEDRVMVENAQRPKYFNYVTLSASGVTGNIYGQDDIYQQKNSRSKSSFDRSRNNISGNFGTQWGANVAYKGCTVNAYENAMKANSQQQRNNGALNNGYKTYNNKVQSGMY